jgi:hypothetical protein
MLGLKMSAEGDQDQSGAYALAEENKTQAAPERQNRGLLRRMLRRMRHATPETGDHSATIEKSALDLADIQGIILRRVQNADGEHFLLRVGIPAQARRQLGGW